MRLQRSDACYGINCTGRMLKLLLILALSIFFLGCSSERTYTPTLENAIAGGISSDDPEKMRDLIDELDKNQVPYTLMSDGIVTYKIKDIAKFKKVERSVFHGKELDENYFESEANEGVKHIFWSQKYGPAVDHILQKVAEEKFRNELLQSKDS